MAHWTQSAQLMYLYISPFPDFFRLRIVYRLVCPRECPISFRKYRKRGNKCARGKMNWVKNAIKNHFSYWMQQETMRKSNAIDGSRRHCISWTKKRLLPHSRSKIEQKNRERERELEWKTVNTKHLFRHANMVRGRESRNIRSAYSVLVHWLHCLN